MIEAAEKVVRFVAGRGRLDLDQDDMLQFACIHGIAIIGEAAAKVSATTRDATPTIPWRNMIGMRNLIVHAYTDFDLELVWKTATEELPELLTQLRSIVGPPDP